jgi:hypothetical protein
MTNLDDILNQLVSEVEIPHFQAEHHEDDAKQRLLEHLEIQKYEFQPLKCTHHDLLGIGEDCVACQEQQWQETKTEFHKLMNELGVAHTHTLQAAFFYYQTLITQYRLTECDELLNAV